MYRQALLTTLLALPIFSTAVEDLLTLTKAARVDHNLVNPSSVIFLDQLPSEAYDNDPDLTAYKNVVYIRKDIEVLDQANGPKLTCLPNGQVTFEFKNESALRVSRLASDELLDHPVIIPHYYDASSCPELTNHTIFGPRESVPAESFDGLDTEDDFAIFIPVFESDVNGTTLTLSVAWATYHEIVGIVGDAPEALSWLAKSVFFPGDTSSSSVQKRRIIRPPPNLLRPPFYSIFRPIRPGGGGFVDGIGTPVGGNQTK